MSGYETHNKFTALLILIITGALVYLYDPKITLSLKDGVLFGGWGLLHVLLITPDFNWNSIPNRRLGPIGWVARKLIKGHRENFTHSYKFWAGYFLVSYFLLGWWTTGGIIPILSHLILDKEGTKIKQLKNRIKKALSFKNTFRKLKRCIIHG